MNDSTPPLETFWLINCGEIQFTLADDPSHDIASARQNGEETITVEDIYGGETTLVVAHVSAWWKETPEGRAAAYRQRKFLRDEEKGVTGFDGGDNE